MLVRLIQVAFIGWIFAAHAYSTDFDRLAFYKHLHANPELSFQEQKTAALLAETWRKAGFDVTENVGGFGVVGL